MARQLAGNVAELLSRAERGGKAKKPSPQPKPVEVDRRYVYNGDPQARTPGYAVRPENRKVTPTKRKRSTFNVVALMFCCAIGIVLYISNLLTVNQLAVEVHHLQTQYDKIRNTNNLLKAEINQKSAWERIGNAAKNEVGLTYAKERARQFDVDADRLDEFKDK